MPAFCFLLLSSYFSKNYAGKIGSSLFSVSCLPTRKRPYLSTLQKLYVCNNSLSGNLAKLQLCLGIHFHTDTLDQHWVGGKGSSLLVTYSDQDWIHANMLKFIYTVTGRHMITMVLVGAYFLFNLQAQPTKNSYLIARYHHNVVLLNICINGCLYFLPGQ